MPGDWMERALCRDWSYKVFFWDDGSRDEDPTRVRRAKAICSLCPVRKPCLTDALTHEQAGSVQLGHAQFISWWRKDCDHKECNKHWVPRARPEFKWKDFTASSTPAQGVWGGFTATERHKREVKHKPDCKRKQGCRGCVPIEEWTQALFAREELGA